MQGRVASGYRRSKAIGLIPCRAPRSRQVSQRPRYESPSLARSTVDAWGAVRCGGGRWIDEVRSSVRCRRWKVRVRQERRWTLQKVPPGAGALTSDNARGGQVHSRRWKGTIAHGRTGEVRCESCFAVFAACCARK